MRYLLDTNAYIYWATDQDLLDVDVYDLLNEPDAAKIQKIKDLAKFQIDKVTQCYLPQGWHLPYEVDCWIHQHCTKPQRPQ